MLLWLRSRAADPDIGPTRSPSDGAATGRTFSWRHDDRRQRVEVDGLAACEGDEVGRDRSARPPLDNHQLEVLGAEGDVEEEKKGRWARES